MRRCAFLMLCVTVCAIAACGGSGDVTPPIVKVKPDPYATIHLTSALDTNTAWGRATWDLYVIFTGVEDRSPNGLGVFPQGTLNLDDIRLGHNIRCFGFNEDTVGNRLITLLAVADTVHITLDSDAASVAAAWFAGNHTLPSGWAALVVGPVDPVVSTQYLAGHGLAPADPVRWTLSLAGAGNISFTEAPSDSCTP